MREIIVDNFAGGGGASTGIELATGRSVDIAINHDPAAIAMHRVNHPDTEHYQEDVWAVDPREACADRPVALAWFSPSCTHHSNAAAGKPKNKQLRGQAWLAVRWAATVRPRVMILENVKEFQTWGPLLENGQPDPKRKALSYNTFVNAMKRQGYKVETKILKACDYGAPTGRERFFMAMRSDGKRIVWPEPTHGDPNSPEVQNGQLKPWRTAAEIIDWSLPCPSIFSRKKPLADKTLRRIARGIQKFIVENEKPFIAPDHSEIGNLGDKSDMVTAFISKYYGEVSPTDSRGHRLDEPLHTITTANRFALITSHLVKLRGNNTGSAVTDSVPAITAGGTHIGEVRSFLIKYYGVGVGQDLTEPLHTIPTKDRFGLVIVKGEPYQIADIGMRMLQPHELFAAQGFPDNYVIDVDAAGKKYSKSAQVARCGNAVPPPFAEALVRANLPELCTGSGNRLVLERYAEQEPGQLAFSI
ncbi:DNA cytosine methyltransferase [Paenibacillus polymyxa]|uniref:DNA cytosine methyltransferase n=1 Tax=Paenibacillus polymyxa TaxID=1406 RepID=UPI001F0F0048|nr:DNA cytosine methyltransferase [Paenibacillus polymyxa]UMR33700.1 DNA cytosine methyltransferase [Paenibacillus polymyxa]